MRSPSAGTPVAPVAPRPWITEVKASALGEAVFLYKKVSGGIAARTVSGSFSRDLVAVSPHEAMFDPALELLWLRDGEKLDVVDLRAPVPTVQPIAGGLPALASAEITVAWQGDSYTVERPSSCDTGTKIELRWASPPELSVISEDSTTANLPGRTWLEANGDRERKPAAQLMEFLTAEDPQRVQLPKGFGRCEDPDDCGMALRFGATGLLLVLVAAADGGDCRHFSCLIHDPATKMFASPAAPTRWKAIPKIVSRSCGPFAFDATGNNYLLKSAVCSPRAGCSALDGVTIDWLERGFWMGAP